MTTLAPTPALRGLLLLALAAAGCYSGRPDPFPGFDPGADPVRLPEGTSVLIEVRDLDGAPMPRAIVTVADAHLPLADGGARPVPPGESVPATAPPSSPLAQPFARTPRGAQYMADGAGRLLLENLPSGRFVARVEAPGHAPASVVVALREGAHRRRVTLLPVEATIPFSAEHGARVAHDGVVVDIPPLGLVDARGEPAVGLVEATIAPLDPTTDLTATPGPLTAVSEDGRSVDLESFFMAEVSLWQDGRPLQLAPGTTARVELTLPEGFAATAAAGKDTIPAWWYDLDAGLWREEGAGRIVPSSTQPDRLAWVADVAHFTWWNVDAPITEHSCFLFSLEDANGDPVPNVPIFAVGIDYDGISEETTDNEGKACLAIKRNSKAKVLVGAEHEDDPGLLMDPFVIEGTADAAACNGEGYDCIPVNLSLDDKPAECQENASKDCPYPAIHADKLGIGVCAAGTAFCMGGKWQPCEGEVLPSEEACDTPTIDEDCDGSPDNDQEGCTCNFWDPPKSCYDGPLETLGVGQCKAGKQVCDLKTHQYGACTMPADVEPAEEEDCYSLDQADPNDDENCDGNPGCGHHDWHRGFGDALRQAAFDVAPGQSTVFVAGRFEGSLDIGGLPPAPTYNVFLAGFSPAGPAKWAFDLGPSWIGEVDTVAIDDALYVVGTIAGPVAYNGNTCAVAPTPGDPGDAVIAKFDAVGQCQWVRRIHGLGLQRGTSIARRPGGGFVVAGAFGNELKVPAKNMGKEFDALYQASGEDHVFAVEFDADGLLIAPFILDTNWPANLSETPAVAVGPNDELFLVGAFGGTMTLCNEKVEASVGTADVFVARILNGNCTWHAEFAAESPRAFSVAADSLGSVVLAGEVDGAIDLGDGQVGDAGDNVFLVKLAFDGAYVWGEVFPGRFPLAAFGGQTIAVDAAGRVALAGSFAGATTIQDEMLATDPDGSILVAKFGPRGDLQWAQALGLAGRQDAGAVAIDADNWTYVAGGFSNQIDFVHKNKLWTFLQMKVGQPGDLGDAFLAHLHI